MRGGREVVEGRFVWEKGNGCVCCVQFDRIKYGGFLKELSGTLAS